MEAVAALGVYLGLEIIRKCKIDLVLSSGKLVTLANWKMHIQDFQFSYNYLSVCLLSQRGKQMQKTRLDDWMIDR